MSINTFSSMIEKMSPHPKRIRGANFTEEEKILLWSIAMKYKTLIENKQTNKAINRMKEKVWGKITTAYNAQQTTGIRTIAGLKVLYDNMKRTAKKNLRQDRNATSIDGETYTSMSHIDKLVSEEIKGEDMPLTNPFDTSSKLFDDSNPSSSSDEYENSCSELVTVSYDDPLVSPAVPTKHKQEAAKAKMQAAKHTSKKNDFDLSDNMSKRTDNDETLNKLKADMLIEEHEKKMQLLDLKIQVALLKKKLLEKQIAD